VRGVTQRACAALYIFSHVRSFVRIHETSLKKQGLSSLTFDKTDAKYYDKIQPSDRVPLIGLDQFDPGKVKSKLKICSNPARVIH